MSISLYSSKWYYKRFSSLDTYLSTSENAWMGVFLLWRKLSYLIRTFGKSCDLLVKCVNSPNCDLSPTTAIQESSHCSQIPWCFLSPWMSTSKACHFIFNPYRLHTYSHHYIHTHPYMRTSAPHTHAHHLHIHIHTQHTFIHIHTSTYLPTPNPPTYIILKL